ncbi:MAG: hypothetical protein ACYDDF_01065 [Thermoplasmatota archaeon]
MAQIGETSSDYLGAFMDGLEFALLALEGRLPDTPETRAFLEDYRRILERHRDSAGKFEPVAARVFGRVLQIADLSPAAKN